MAAEGIPDAICPDGMARGRIPDAICRIECWRKKNFRMRGGRPGVMAREEFSDAMCPDGMAAEEFRMRYVRVECSGRNSGCDMSGWNERGYE